MKKVVRDGKVAVLYSPGFGAGWSTWNDVPELTFDPEIIALVEAGKRDEIGKHLLARGYEDFYAGGAEQLKIEWIPEGYRFKITEYDGSESIELQDSDDWITA